MREICKKFNKKKSHIKFVKKKNSDPSVYYQNPINSTIIYIYKKKMFLKYFQCQTHNAHIPNNVKTSPLKTIQLVFATCLSAL